jgi:hypothetical protein
MSLHREALVAVLLVSSLLAGCAGDDEPQVSSQTTTTGAPADTTTTTAACSTSGVNTDLKTANGDGTVALLTDVRTGRQPCADRVVFDFRAGTRPSYTVEYQTGPTFALGESDQTINVEGSAFLVVRFEPGSGVDLSGPQFVETYTGPESIHPTGLTHVQEIRRIEDFEAVLIWVIGLDATRPFSVGVLDGPPRVYVDIS